MEQQFQLVQSKLEERTRQLLESERKLMEERDQVVRELQEVRQAKPAAIMVLPVLVLKVCADNPSDSDAVAAPQRAA
jgi:hypothetical protein